MCNNAQSTLVVSLPPLLFAERRPRHGIWWTPLPAGLQTPDSGYLFFFFFVFCPAAGGDDPGSQHPTKPNHQVSQTQANPRARGGVVGWVRSTPDSLSRLQTGNCESDRRFQCSRNLPKLTPTSTNQQTSCISAFICNNKYQQVL